MKMNHPKLAFTALLLATTLYSCNNKNIEQTDLPDTHSSQTSLDWQGTYSGNLPCADCDHIETELTLTDELNYILISQYIGKDKPLSDTLEGKFNWEGNNIKLDGIKENETPSMYKVEENQVRQLDMKGNPISGDLETYYIMKKDGNLNVEDKRWQLVEINGKAVKGTPETHYIIFHSNDRNLEAKVDCNVLLNNYKIKNELQLTIVPGITTLMACEGNLEQEFSDVLKTADNISSDGKTLSLNKARMSPLARFELVIE